MAISPGGSSAPTAGVLTSDALRIKHNQRSNSLSGYAPLTALLLFAISTPLPVGSFGTTAGVLASHCSPSEVRLLLRLTRSVDFPFVVTWSKLAPAQEAIFLFGLEGTGQ
uniref:Uncharacterized protein n=1 Tax=Aegilops tauschii TaxID=37682 RepID=R7W9Z3_AEGTA